MFSNIHGNNKEFLHRKNNIYKSNVFGGFNLRFESRNSDGLFPFFVVTELCCSGVFFFFLLSVHLGEQAPKTFVNVVRVWWWW